MLLLAVQHPSFTHHTLGLRNASPFSAETFYLKGTGASSCLESCSLNPHCQAGRQGSLRAELRWDYKPLDLACFSVVLCFLSHSIILHLSSRGCNDYRGLCSYTNKLKCGGLAAIVRMLFNKGISGNPWGFEDWRPNAAVTVKFRPKRLINTEGALLKK